MFGLGIVLVLLGITIIVLWEILKSFLRRLQTRMKAKIEAREAGPWDFMLKLVEEIFAVIKTLPEALRVAFLLIILGIIVIVLGYSMAIGYWPPIR